MCPTTFLKSDRIKNILFSFIFVWFGVEKLREGKKMNLNKFTHKPLLKNDVQLKQKKVTNNHKKRAITQILYKKKIMSKKKKITSS